MRDKIESAMMILDERFPLFVAHLSSLDVVKSDDVGSLATDGTVLLYSENYVASNAPETLVFGLAHTACILSFDYINRKGDRDNLYWSIAATLVISRFLEEQGMVIPDHVFLPVTVDDDEDIVTVYNRIVDGPVREMIESLISPKIDDREIIEGISGGEVMWRKIIDNVMEAADNAADGLPWKV